MENLSFYEIRVEGYLTDRWSDWFDGLAILNDPKGETILSGWFVDQAALFGTLAKIQALNLRLLSVNRL
jgi:cellobiose phosphorylase